MPLAPAPREAAARPSPAVVDAFIARILAGEQRAGARMMRLVDDRHPLATELLRRLFPHTGRAVVIGVTGNPGSGKSTLTDQLVKAYRGRGERVAVIAVDPSSPFSGGAILGDRIRMNDHATDPGVFIRSVATRGHLGGLSRSTNDIVHVLDAMGYDRILLETVGVGQDEVEVVKVAHTSVVVLVPGLGDEIQAIKAGILEIADVFVVNKADRDGVDRTVKDIKLLQSLAPQGDGSAWTAPILRTTALRGDGVAELVSAVDGHAAHLADHDEAAMRDQRREDHILTSLVRDALADALDAHLEREGGRQALLARLITREADPYSEAARIVAALLAGPPPAGDGEA